MVDITAVVAGQASALSAADQFTYGASDPAVPAPVVTGGPQLEDGRTDDLDGGVQVPHRPSDAFDGVRHPLPVQMAEERHVRQAAVFDPRLDLGEIVRKIVDEEAVKKYKDEHMDSI